MTEIFVFGSNIEGRHKKGAALCALKDHGAIMGQGVGLQGNSYAIPTKSTPWKPLSLFIINTHVSIFMIHAIEHPENYYLVTPIGCGLAGHDPRNIAPMFRLATDLHNVRLPKEFLHYLDKEDWF
jgi:hypothetical protein